LKKIFLSALISHSRFRVIHIRFCAQIIINLLQKSREIFERLAQRGRNTSTRPVSVPLQERIKKERNFLLKINKKESENSTIN